MKQLLKIVFCIVYIFINTQISFAQTDTEFWFAAPDVSKHNDNLDVPIYIRLSTFHDDATVNISIPANPAFVPIIVNVPANSSESVDLSAYLDLIECRYNEIAGKGIYIRSTKPINAYYDVASSYCECNPEFFSLKGKNALGNEFYLPFQNITNNHASYIPQPFAQFIVLATEDNTIVTITPTTDLQDNHPAGISYNVVLQRGEVYAPAAADNSASGHPTGTHITSNKPVAVTLSDDLLSGGLWGGCADLVGDQLVPVTTLGKKYVLHKGNLDPVEPEKIFIVSTVPNTDIFVNGNLQTNLLNAGASTVIDLADQSMFIESSEPVYVFHLSGKGCELGGALIPPIECRGSYEVSFVRPSTQSLHLTIVVKAGHEDAFLVNGIPGILMQSMFRDIPGTNGEYLSTNVIITNQFVTEGESLVVVNTEFVFQMGVIVGEASGGCSYGYFSDFSLVYKRHDTLLCGGGDAIELSVDSEKTNILWNTGETTHSINAAAEGIYWCNSELDQCPATDTFFVDIHTLTISNDTVIDCNDDVQIMAGFDFETYVWNNGAMKDTITVSQAGQYIVTVTEGTCTLSDTVNVSTNCDMLAYYRFCGCSLEDLSGNGFDLKSSPLIVPTCEDSKFDKGYHFSGAMDEFLHAPNLPTPNQSFSLMAWVKVEEFMPGTIESPILSFGFNYDYITLWVTAESVELLLNWSSAQSKWMSTPATLEKDVYYHVAATYDYVNQVVKLYLDGELIYTDTYQYEIGTSNEGLYISSSYPGGDEFFTGLIDEVRIYNTALTDSDIQSIYNLNYNTFIDLGPDILINEGESYLIEAPAGYSNYLWQDNVTTQNRIVTEEGEYWLKVDDNDGCELTDTIIVTVKNIDTLDYNICEGRDYTLEAYAGNSFLWDDMSSASEYEIINIQNPIEKWVDIETDTSIFRLYYNISVQTCILEINNDTTICLGDSTYTQAYTTGSFLGWRPNGLHPDYMDTLQRWFTPDASVSLQADAIFQLHNLIPNNDFDSGTIDFQTEYIENIDLHPGNYMIADNPYNSFNSAWARSFSDHTTGSGNMLIVDGDDVLDKKVFYTRAYIQQGKDYFFSTWIKNAHQDLLNPPQLQFYAGVTSLGTFEMEAGESDWVLAYAKWEAPVSGFMEIGIRNWNLQSDGNVYALDDLYFGEIMSASKTLNIDILPLPEVEIGVTNPMLCEGESTIVTTTGAENYVWDNGISSGVAFSPIATTTYSVTGTDVNGCRDTAKVEIIVTPVPNVDLGENDTICDGGQVVFSAPDNMDSYLWNSGEITQSITKSVSGEYSVTVTKDNCSSNGSVELEVLSDITVDLGNDTTICEGNAVTFSANPDMDSYEWNTGETSQSITRNTSGIYSVTVTKDVCVASDEIILMVNPKPEVDLGDDIEICEGWQVVISASSNMDSYVWSSGETTQTITKSESGEYEVTVTKNNCSSSSSVELTVNPIPMFDLGNDTAICAGSTVTFTTASGMDSYVWSSGETEESITKDASGVYSVTVTHNGCESTDEVELTVYPIPDVDLGDDATICEGEDVVISAPPNMDAYVWSSGETTQSITKSESGEYEVTVTKNNCSNSSSVELTVNLIPIFDLGNDTTICNGNTVTFTSASGMDSYIWSSGETVESITKDASGVYSVTVTHNGCESNDEVELTVYPIPDVDLGDDATICEGEDVVISAPPNMDSYLWSSGETTQSITKSESGEYEVTVSMNNCVSTDSKRLIVYPIPSIPVLNDTVLCMSNGMYAIEAEGQDIHWYTDISAEYEIVPPSSIDLSVPGEYNYYLKSVSEYNCNSTLIHTKITVLSSNSSLKIAGPDSMCMGNFGITYQVKLDSLLENLNWTISNNTPYYSTNKNAISVDWLLSGVETIFVSAEDTNGCMYSDSMVVKVSPFPEASFTSIPLSNQSATVITNTSSYSRISEIDESIHQTYYWDFYNTGEYSNVEFKDTSIQYAYGTHIINMYVENDFGCKDSTSGMFFIDIFTSLYVPTAFYPNSQAPLVRVFQPTGMGLKSYEIWVFDKWGNMIWYSDKLTDSGEPAESWNGEYNGKVIQSGAYIWKIEAVFKDDTQWKGIQIKRGEYRKIGNVYLVR